MPLIQLPPSPTDWQAGADPDNALLAAAMPTLTGWLQSIQAAHHALGAKNDIWKRDAIVLADASTFLGRNLLKRLDPMPEDSALIAAPAAVAVFQGLAVRCEEGTVFGVLVAPQFSGCDDATCHEVHRVLAWRVLNAGTVPADTVLVAEAGAFGLRLRFAALREGRPCWSHAWHIPCTPSPGGNDGEAFLRLLHQHLRKTARAARRRRPKQLIGLLSPRSGFRQTMADLKKLTKLIERERW